MIGAGVGTEEASRAKFTELAPLLRSRAASLKVKGKV